MFFFVIRAFITLLTSLSKFYFRVRLYFLMFQLLHDLRKEGTTTEQMEVNRFNAPLILDEFRRLVSECDFYAVDQEMTGIACPGAREDYGMDLVEAYAPKRNAATRYSAFQFGVALFTKKQSTASVQEKVEFDVRPFNFLLLKSDKDGEVVLSADAVQFLAQNHMNFQSWLTTGMNFVTASKEETERKKFFPEDTWEEVLTADEKKWVEDMESRILAWYNDDGASQKPLELTDKHLHSNVDVALHYKLQLAQQQSNVWISVSPAFDSGVPSWDRKKTTITKMASLAAVEEVRTKEIARRERVLSERIGFRSFWNALVDSKKPQIGHNYSSDLMFMLNQNDAVLPSSYREFKSNVHRLFPVIFDTKNLAALLPLSTPKDATIAPFKNTSLEPLFKESVARWGREFEFRFPLGFEGYHPKMVANTSGTSGAVAHQGAFDAYMTGVVYAMIVAKLPEELRLEAENMIAVFGNHLSMNLVDGGRDACVARSAFHVSFSRRKMKRDDVKELLLTDLQAEQVEKAAAAAKAEKGGAKPPAPPVLDFHQTLLDKGDAYAAMNREKSNAIVAIFEPNVLPETIFKRIENSVERQRQQRSIAAAAAATPTENVTPSSVAEGTTTPQEEEPLVFVVTPFLEWKAECQASALLSTEPPLKQCRTETTGSV